LQGIKVKFVYRNELDRWAESDAHQGVAALAQQPQEKSLNEILAIEGSTGPLVLLDGVEDPRNFGAILRSALAAGAAGVVTTKDRSAPLSPVAVKASAGAAFVIPIARVTNLARTLDDLKDRDYWVFGADIDAEQTIYQVEWAVKSAIILGGEGRGLRELVKKKCDILFRIPINPKVESLNVSVAAGVILFEFRRRLSGF
jgi:23S rRNA (guanosine2251-2'-O)-methyltransferase